MRRPTFCAETVHVDVDVSKAWDDSQQQQRLCEQLSTSGDGAIRDVAIFAMSTGNLLLADAVQKGRCSLDMQVDDVIWTAVEVRIGDAAHHRACPRACALSPPSLFPGCGIHECAAAWRVARGSSTV